MKQLENCPKCGSTQIFCFEGSITEAKLGQDFCTCRDCGYTCYGFECECDSKDVLTEKEKIDRKLYEVLSDLRMVWKQLSYINDNLKDLHAERVIEEDLSKKLNELSKVVISVYSKIDIVTIDRMKMKKEVLTK